MYIAGWSSEYSVTAVQDQTRKNPVVRRTLEMVRCVCNWKIKRKCNQYGGTLSKRKLGSKP